MSRPTPRVCPRHRSRARRRLVAREDGRGVLEDERGRANVAQVGDRRQRRVDRQPVLRLERIVAVPVPADRVAMMRAAFEKTMTDETFLADAARLRLVIEPMSHQELARITAKVVSSPKEVVELAKF